MEDCFIYSSDTWRIPLYTGILGEIPLYTVGILGGIPLHTVGIHGGFLYIHILRTYIVSVESS